jgi:hypothetical protein
MQQYAYTKGCRRGFVLRYFGDPAARSSCGGCDNCLGTRVEVEKGSSAGSRVAPARSSRRAPARRGRSADTFWCGRGVVGSAARSSPNHFARRAGSGLRSFS